MIKNKFKHGNVDTTIFINKKNEDLLAVQIYVDDIIFGATIHSLCEKFANLMKENFEMSMMEELNFFLWIQIKQEKEWIFVNQTKYIKKILKKFGANEKSASTLMSNICKFDKDEKGKRVDQKFYQSIIGSLPDLTVSRPDIMFSVYMCTRYQSELKESHLIATKRILSI